MHLKGANGKHTLCEHTGDAAVESTHDIKEADCEQCLWTLVKVSLVQHTGALQRLQVVIRSQTVRG